MQREATWLTKLGVANGQQATLEINIAAIEPYQFTDAHTGDHEQAEHGDIGMGPESGGGRQLAGSVQELGDLSITIAIRGVTLGAVR
jgi:hypothetical protein